MRPGPPEPRGKGGAQLMPKCAGTKRDGGRCAMVVDPGHSHCYQHDPDRAEERRRNASRGGRAKGNGELADLKKRLKELAAGVLDGSVDRGRAAVANQLYNTLIRATEQERKLKETEELAREVEELRLMVDARRERRSG
jgi:hypothetical protein